MSGHLLPDQLDFSASIAAMDDDSRQILAAQSRFLLDRQSIEFLLGVGPFLRALAGDTRLAAHQADLRADADELGRDHLADEQKHAREDLLLLELIWMSRTSAPGADNQWFAVQDSKATSLSGGGARPARLDLDPHSMLSGSQIWDYVELVDEAKGHVGAADPGAAHKQGFDRLYDEAYERQLRLIATARHHPGVALMRLMLLAEVATVGATGPFAVASRPPKGGDPALTVAMLSPGEGLAAEIAELAIDPSGPISADCEALIQQLRQAAELVAMELERRLGTTRSVLALIDRFRIRAQTHDRERLQKLADKSGKREERLRDELALYLFDAGLNPLTEVSLGVTRSDLIDPSLAQGFLLEAKQYTAGGGTESELRAAFRQALDTANELGDPYAAAEAFVVLFRRDGPRAVFPAEPLELEGRRWYFRLVDLQTSDKAGSRAELDPKSYTLDELRKLLLEAKAERKATSQSRDEG